MNVHRPGPFHHQRSTPAPSSKSLMSFVLRIVCVSSVIVNKALCASLALIVNYIEVKFSCYTQPTSQRQNTLSALRLCQSHSQNVVWTISHIHITLPHTHTHSLTSCVISELVLRVYIEFSATEWWLRYLYGIHILETSDANLTETSGSV